MNEFVSQFLVEARELTEQASQDLLALEQEVSSMELLDSAFRAFHTLKGAAGIMEYAPMEQMLHQAEDTLQAIRSGARAVTPDVIDGCLACVGLVIRWLDAIEQTGELPADAEAAARRIAKLVAATPAPLQPSQRQGKPWLDEAAAWAREASASLAGVPVTAIRYQPARDAFFLGEDPVALIAAAPCLLQFRLQPVQPWPALAEMRPFECNVVVEALFGTPAAEIRSRLKVGAGEIEIVELPKIPEAAAGNDAAGLILQAQKDFLLTEGDPEDLTGRIEAAGRVIVNVLRASGRGGEAAPIEAAIAQAVHAGQPAILVSALDSVTRPPAANGDPLPEEATPLRRDVASAAIRVDVEKIDAIVDLTGELLVVKNALGHWMKLAAEGGDMAALAAGLKTQHARLDRHVAELQRAVLDLRVLPLARVFGRFPLLVRETAGRLGKQIAFASEGDNTEADKAVVEALFEPLLHVVRNAIDHGVEPAVEREQAGKPATASILMRGRREGDRVIVEVVDDGRGVNTETVRRLAVERGLMTADAAATINDDEVVDLIFAPGFSTAASVSDLSGRGVGMNAVRAAIERLGGEVSLANAAGQGMTVRFSLPFTVMMTRVMTVEAGGQVFGLPFDAVLETVRAPRSQIRPLGGGQAFVLRDQTIPVLNLAESLNLGPVAANPPETACIVVAWAAGQRVGIEIDRPGERLDMMLKPIEGILAGMPAVSGTSLLGDGRVLVVLDLGALFE